MSQLFLFASKVSFAFILALVVNLFITTDNVPSIMPVEGEGVRIGVDFGEHQHPLYNTSRSHFGIDIYAEENTNVVATADGVIEEVGVSNTQGNYLVINHGDGIKTRYANVTAGKVKNGSRVKKGQAIATVGKSKYTANFQVHYEVEKEGKKIDPKEYL